MSNETFNSELYLTYRFAGPTAALIVPAVLLNIVTISGVLLNSFVVFVTFCTKTLHGTANFLLALISLLEVLHQTGHSIFLVIAVSGINFVSNVQAVRMELVMLFGVNASLCAMACAGFDRLFAVIDQHRHRRLKKPIYLGIHCVACACFGLYSVYYVYEYYSSVDPNSPTTGCISEVLSGPVGEHFFKMTAAMNAVCTLFYLLVWLVIRCKKGVTKETHGRLLKSLVLILLINIGGYFFNLGAYQIFFHLPPGLLHPITIWHLSFVVGIPLNMGVASNAFILYFNSTEYRKAFKRTVNSALVAIFGECHSAGGDNRVHYLRTTQMNSQPSHSGPHSFTTRTPTVQR